MNKDFVRELCLRVDNHAREYAYEAKWQYNPGPDTYRIVLTSEDDGSTIEANIADAGEDPSGAVLLKVEWDTPLGDRRCYVTAQAAALFGILYA